MTDQYQFVITGTDKTARAFKAIKANLGGVRSAINSTQVKIGALVGAAGLGAMISRSLQVNDALAKMADRVGATTEGLAGLQLITELNGESSESLAKSLEKMRRGIGEAGRDIGPARFALQELGIELKDIRDLSADEQFIRIGSAIGELSDANQKASLSADIFGRSGIRLINTFNQGEEAMRAAAKEADDLGIAISRVDAAMIEEANDEMLRAKKAIEGVANKATVALAPIIAEVARQFTIAATEADNLANTMVTGIRLGAKGYGVMADGIHGVTIGYKSAEIVAKGASATMVGSADLVVSALYQVGNTLENGVILPFKGWLEIAALIPGVSDRAAAALEGVNSVLMHEWKPPEGLHGTLVQLTEGISGAREELQQLMLEDLPSAVIDQKLGEILTAAEARAQEIANRVRAGMGEDTGGEDPDADGLNDQERVAAKLMRLEESYLSEQELLQGKFQQEQQLLVDALTLRQLTEDEFQAKQLRSVKSHEEAVKNLEKKAQQSRLSMVGTTLDNIAAATGGRSRKLFKIQQAYALAHAAVTIPPAIIESIQKAGGLPQGLWAGVAMAAQGAKQVAAIKSASLGGAGGSSSFGGGGGSAGGSPLGGGAGLSALPSTAIDQPEYSGRRIVVQITGNVFTHDANEFEEIVVESVKKYTDADGIIFQNNSRQALEITDI